MMLTARLSSSSRAGQLARFSVFLLMFFSSSVWAGCLVGDLYNWGPDCTAAQAMASCQQAWLPTHAAYGGVCCDHPSSFKVTGSYGSCAGGVNYNWNYSDPVCTPPEVLENHVCVPPPVACEEGSFQNGQCVCETGYHLDSGVCMPDTAPVCEAGQSGAYGYLAKSSSSSILYINVSGKSCGYDYDGCEVCASSSEGETCYTFEDGSLFCYGFGKKTGNYAPSIGAAGGPYLPPTIPSPLTAVGDANYCSQYPTYPGCGSGTTQGGQTNPLNQGHSSPDAGTASPGVSSDGLPGSSPSSVASSPSLSGSSASGSASGTPDGLSINEAGTPTGVGFGAGDELQDRLQSEIEEGFTSMTNVDALPIHFDFSLPASSCRPFTFGVLNVERQIDLCPTLQLVRDALAWLYSGLLLIYLWRSATRSES